MTRASWVPLHRWAGLAIAVFIVITGLTGSVIAFREEIDALINPDLYRVTVRADPLLGPSALAARVEAALPAARAGFVYVGAEPGHSTRVLVQGGRDPVTGKRVTLPYDEVFVDPYTGTVLGQRKRRGVGDGPIRAQIIPVIYEVHRTLLAGPIGKWFLGAIAFVWMLDSFVGFYLTLPGRAARKTATQSATQSATAASTTAARPVAQGAARPGKSWWQRWKPAWQIKRGAGFYRTQFDLHRAGGLWLWGVFFTLALTSVHLNLQWVKPVLQQFGDVTPSPFETLPAAADTRSPPALGFDQALAAAITHLPAGGRSLEPLVIGYMQAQRSYYVYFRPSGDADPVPRVAFEQVFIDADTGALKAGVGYDRGTVGDTVLAWQFPLHTGQVAGLPGRMLISAAGLVAALLSCTGVYLWWKKRRARTGSS